MAELLKGAPVARALTEELAARCAALRERGVVPTLAIVRVGEREDDLSYERGALKRCEKVGVAVRQVVLPEDVTQKVLMENIHALNADEKVHGVLMFRPLPGHLDDTKNVLRFLYENYGDSIWISIMNQYTPMCSDPRFPELSRTVSDEEYNEAIDFACELGIENAFVQEGGTVGESFIPPFDLSGV